MSPRAIHLLTDYSGCDEKILQDPHAIEQLLLQAAEAAQATVLTHFSDLREDGGISSVVIIQESHLTVRTFPSKGYAAADFFTCGKAVPQEAHPVLMDGLGATASKVVTLHRGGSRGPFPYVRGHRKVKTIHLDCTGDHIPEGIEVKKSPGRGLGLFATRDFQPGEKVYEYITWLGSFDTIYHIQTDAGNTSLHADELGCELTLDEMAYFPKRVKSDFSSHYGLIDPSDLELREYLTEDRTKEVMVTSFDGLLNHSEDSNLDGDPESIKVFFEDGEPRWLTTTIALKPIRAGEEFFWDYNESNAFKAPEEWKK